MHVETDTIIQRHYPDFLQKEHAKWEHLYPFSYNRYDDCPWKFFCTYYSGVQIPVAHALVLGKQCHELVESYYKNLRVEEFHELLIKKTSIDIVKKYMLQNFTRLTSEHLSFLNGFATMESTRALAIIENYGNSFSAFRSYYMPIEIEKTVKNGCLAGRIDAIFRMDNSACAPLDWKSGKKPALINGVPKLYKDIITQVHIYGMLVDGIKIEGIDEILEATKYMIAYPKHSYLIIGDFDSSVKNEILSSSEEYIDSINSDIFPMRISPETCGYAKGFFKCDYFDIVCKNIMINDLGLSIVDGAVSDA